MLHLILVALLLLLPPGTLRAQEAGDSAGAVQQIRTTLARWVQAANREDWKSAAQVWAPDLIGWYPGQPDDTYAKEMERATHPPSRGKRTRYQVDIQEVMVSGPMAVVRDVWRFTTAPGTPDSVVSVVRSYEVWKQQPDRRWKIARWISAPEP
jgi:ketosteroid isomerase-like protein